MRRIWFLTLLSACITVHAVTVDRKSTLEQQLIGEYEELSDDLVSIASVRAASTGLGPHGDDPYARALQARRLQAFYQEDLERARQRGCAGEALDGRVKALPCDAKPAEGEPKLERIVGIENAAREALVAFALAQNPQLKDADRPLVWQAYRRVVLSHLQKGVKVQEQSGEWAAHAP